MNTKHTQLLQEYAAANKLPVFFGIPMFEYTSFRVGGPSNILNIAETRNVKTIIDAIQFCVKNAVPYRVIGQGSNLLVSDKGYDGLILRISRYGSIISNPNEDIPITLTKDFELITEASVLTNTLISFAKDNGAAGLESLCGIPGTIGGAVYMNAGAFKTEIKDVLIWADVLIDGVVKKYTVQDLRPGYRQTVLAENGGIVLKAAFRTTEDRFCEIAERMVVIQHKRADKQPLEYPSAGSTFKRPKGHIASKLIEQCGLKGHRIGGAQVSEKHAGFIINRDSATAADIYKLIEYVKKAVADKTGIILEPEVQFLGEF